MKRIVVLLISVVVFTSCNKDAIINKSIALSPNGWYMKNGIQFNTEIVDTIEGYDFIVNIRNTVDYRYSNLYIFMTTEFPNGNKARDTIEFILADKQGKWLGKGWGNIKENNIVLNKNMRFPLKGKYSFVIQQAMRTDTLKGVNSIGLTIAKTEN